MLTNDVYHWQTEVIIFATLTCPRVTSFRTRSYVSFSIAQILAKALSHTEMFSKFIICNRNLHSCAIIWIVQRSYGDTEICQISLLTFRNVCPGSDSRVKPRKAKQVRVVQWVLNVSIFLSSKRYANIRFMVNVTTTVVCSHTLGLN